MALFIIERNFAEELALDSAAVNGIQEINDDCSVKWVYSFLSADKRKTYCLYEASEPEHLREAARRANIPADVVIELSGKVSPEDFA